MNCWPDICLTKSTVRKSMTPYRRFETRIRPGSARHVLRITLRFAAEGPAAHEGGEHAPLVPIEARALGFHDAGGQSFIDIFGGHFPDSGGQGRALHSRIAIAGHALGLENGEARFGSGRALLSRRL